jgi:hypothetical protein
MNCALEVSTFMTSVSASVCLVVTLVNWFSMTAVWSSFVCVNIVPIIDYVK